MSLIKSLGLKLLGQAGLAEILKEEAVRTASTVHRKYAQHLSPEAAQRQVDAALVDVKNAPTLQFTVLRSIVGDSATTIILIDAVKQAEASGESFMKKKSAVLKVIKEVAPGLTKSQNQLAIELAVQLAKQEG